MTATRERQGHEPAAPVARDEVFRFGSEGQLVGIVSHPDEGKARTPAAPAVIVLNAGVLHRIGPHRLHVTLTRRLARRGIACLRLDLGGIGDSTTTSQATRFWDSAVDDTRVAMTGLEGAIGARRFIIFGICAGADNALSTALADDRVAGIVLVDPAMYETRRSRLRELYRGWQPRELRRRIEALGGPVAAARLAARAAVVQVRERLERLRRRGEPGPPPEEGRGHPPAEEFCAQLTRLVDRGVHIFAVYAGSHGAGYNHADQLFESFPRLRGRVDCSWFPDANHTFTQLDDQAALIDATERWIASRFG
jgi:hypothetical protein